MEMAFEAYGKPLEAVPSFKYLGRIMTVGDDNSPAVAGNLVRVAGTPLDDAARKGEGGIVELERLSHGRRTKNISDRFPDQGRAEGLPSGGMPRKCWYTDGDEDEFL